jgi:hypothetical protein
MKRTLATVAMTVVSLSGSARAQSAATCAFDAGTATVTVRVDGVAAKLLAAKASGQIRVDGVACGAATVSNTDTIRVEGVSVPDDDIVTMTGSFVPGLTLETDGASEIEIVFAVQQVTMNLTNRADHLLFAPTGIDVGRDGDADITFSGYHQIFIHALDGDDHMDASAYAGPSFVALYGGAGNDRVIGSDGPDSLCGEEGDDIIDGRAGNDWLYPGPGDDIARGGAGNDNLASDNTLDGTDQMLGGTGNDWVYYTSRLEYVTVTLNNGLADDGADGEGDLVESMENAYAGRGGSLLVGTAAANFFNGGPGADEMYGGGGDDILQGYGGPDVMFGEEGEDWVSGLGGPDTLDGGAGADEIHCGTAVDHVAPDPLDTVDADCEL